MSLLADSCMHVEHSKLIPIESWQLTPCSGFLTRISLRMRNDDSQWLTTGVITAIPYLNACKPYFHLTILLMVLFSSRAGHQAITEFQITALTCTANWNVSIHGQILLIRIIRADGCHGDCLLRTCALVQSLENWRPANRRHVVVGRPSCD